jgi:hypothetical protein
MMKRDSCSGIGFGILGDPDYLKRDQTYFGTKLQNSNRIPTLFGNFSDKQQL